MARPNGTAAVGPVFAVSAGQAVLEVAREGFAGRVEGVFRDGFYVSGSDETLFAVVGPGCWPGPLHLVVDNLAGLPGRRDRVSVSGDELRAGRLTVRFDGCAPWAPSLPEGLGSGSWAWRDLAVCPAPELATVWEAVTRDLRGGDLVAASRRLQGRGTGLTPSGDDVLAGILLVGAIDPGQRRALTGVARGARTTRLSRAFLKWAACGHSIQPAHALLDAAAAGDQAGMRRAAASLARVGATSGQALASGVALAATELPHVPAQLGYAPVLAANKSGRGDAAARLGYASALARSRRPSGQLLVCDGFEWLAARPWPERPVSAANKSGRGDAAARLGYASALARRMNPRPNGVWRRSGDHPDAHL